MTMHYSERDRKCVEARVMERIAEEKRRSEDQRVAHQDRIMELIRLSSGGGHA